MPAIEIPREAWTNELNGSRRRMRAGLARGIRPRIGAQLDVDQFRGVGHAVGQVPNIARHPRRNPPRACVLLQYIRSRLYIAFPGWRRRCCVVGVMTANALRLVSRLPTNDRSIRAANLLVRMR